MKNIAVFFGGQSVEHDVSIITGVLTLNTVNRAGYNAIPVYIDKNGRWYTGESLSDPEVYKKLNYKNLTAVTVMGGSNILYAIKGKKLKEFAVLSAGINCMHGERGEDGCLAGVFNMCGVPLASPNILPSAVSMNKSVTKIILRGLKIPVLNSITVSSMGECAKCAKNLGFPLIVKPNCGGSSIGVRLADNLEELKSAVCYALRFGEMAIIEPCLENFTEINCSAYLSKDGTVHVSECEQPTCRGGVLTFNDKYVSGERIFPAPISKEVSDYVKRVTKRVYKKLCFSGIIRIDYLLKNDKIYLNEINTVPGSLAYYLFCEDFSQFAEMLKDIISVSQKQSASASVLQRDYNSGILTFSGSKGAKHLKK